jgi:sirohydrochlorin ferrochelatase
VVDDAGILRFDRASHGRLTRPRDDALENLVVDFEIALLVRVFDGGTVEFEGVGYAPEGRVLGVEAAGPAAADVALLLTTGALACNARLVQAEGRWTVLGDPTEAAVEVACTKAGVDLDETSTPTEGRWAIVPPWFYAKLLLDDRFVKAGTAATDAVRRPATTRTPRVGRSSALFRP